ncbi:MAG: NAD(P)-binding domain-containing protein, partial [Holophagales bacterium]|nr:NAD(P)-binding domain-containing protein [Holophagales bacterium]
VAREHGLSVEVFELGSGVGGNWRFRNDNGMSAAYRSLHINTSKEKMAYSDYPMPEDYPDYPHHSQILDYFEDYVDHFGFRDTIRFHTRVEKVEPAGDGSWWVRVRGPEGTEERQRYRAVLIANGHHWSPRWPSFEGELEGRVMHSHEYETPDGFEDKKVLIVGIGNSAVDIACETCRVAEKVFLSTRRSAHILPKYAFGKPIDHFTSPLGSKMPLAVQRRFFETVLGVSRGPQERFGVPLPEHHILQAHPTISAELLNLVGHGKITMKPNVEKLDGGSVCFVDGSREEVEIAVYATGYHIDFPFLDPAILDPEGNQVGLYRHVAHPAHPGLYFIGLVQPLGAIMPLAEAQAEWVSRLLTGRATLPGREEMEREIEKDRQAMRRRYVTSDRHTIQVDFYPYLHQIEREMRRAAN